VDHTTHGRQLQSVRLSHAPKCVMLRLICSTVLLPDDCSGALQLPRVQVSACRAEQPELSAGILGKRRHSWSWREDCSVHGGGPRPRCH
jgi:hypothetical protein